MTATEPLSTETASWHSDDPFLRGVFAPQMSEVESVDLPVTGELPDALSGVYLRNGSNPEFPPLGAYHWFDGDGMIHGLTIEGGKASYRNRWVRTPGLLRERDAGHALFGGIANVQFPEADVMAECGIFKNAANTNIVRHAGSIMALWEGGFPCELSPTLDTIGLKDYGGKLVGAMTAHPKWDARTGEMMFFGYTGMERPFLRYHVADASGALVHSTEIDLPHGVMMHDFVCTEHYSIFWDFPVVVELAHMMSGEPMWQPDFGARIGVLPRHADGSDIRWFDIDPCFVFHFMNAWEEGDEIVAYGCRMPSISLDFSDVDLSTASMKGVGLTKWTIDLTTGSVSEEQISEGRQDFPRLHDDLLGYRNRYGHLSTSLNGNSIGGFDAITQFDLHTGTTVTKHLRPGTSTGEAVFAADPSGTDERDGWVLTYELDAATGSTDLLVLDGHDITTEVARVHLPQRVPPGFHGNWLPN
jgi:carotenoid cleavage dioxygenase-like enzyme